MTRLRVSVLLPTYQRPALLREALDSLRRQTMPLSDFEVIVINDGGPAVEANVLDGLTGQVVNQPQNRGLSAALNAGLACARAPYCTIASDDDLVLPDKLRALSDALDQAPEHVVATFGLPVYTDEMGVPLGVPPHVRAFATTHPLVTSQVALIEGLHVHGTGLVYRTASIRDAGGWDETLPTAEEWDLHHRLLRYHGLFQFVDVEVVTYRKGGKHAQYRGKRPREVMDRIYAKLQDPIRGTF